MFRLAAHSLLAFAASFTAAAAAPVTLASAGSTFQNFTAPTAGTYDIVAFGVQGGPGMVNNLPVSGGLGAEIGGDFILTAGETLSIAVGTMGGFNGSGGGGRSFDAGTNQVLVAGFNSGDGSVVITELSAAPVPEPASLAQLGIGLAGLLIVRRRPAS